MVFQVHTRALYRIYTELEASIATGE